STRKSFPAPCILLKRNPRRAGAPWRSELAIARGAGNARNGVLALAVHAVLVRRVLQVVGIVAVIGPFLHIGGRWRQQRTLVPAGRKREQDGQQQEGRYDAILHAAQSSARVARAASTATRTPVPCRRSAARPPTSARSPSARRRGRARR